MIPYIENLLIYTGIIATAILVGGILPLFKNWHQDRLPTLLSLAAGIMLGSAFFHLIPESYEILHKNVGVYILSGFLFLYLIEKLITVHICEVFDCEVHHLGISAFIGLAIHTFINGVALGSGMMIPGLGLVVFLAVATHKAPEAFSLSSVLLHTGMQKKKIVLIQTLILLMIPLGGLLAFYLIQGTDVALIGKAIGFSAGTFLHISLSDLLPEVHKHSQSRFKNLIAFIAGLALMWALANHLEVH